MSGGREPGATSGVIVAAEELLRAEAAVITSISNTAIEQLETIAGELITLTGKIVIIGAGTSGYVARRAAHLFSVCGSPAMFLHPADALHGAVASLQPQDFLIGLSKGGRTAEVNDVIRFAKERGVHTVALTSAERSEMSELADQTVRLPADDLSDPGGMIAMGSTLAASAWLDALAYVLMRAKGYDFGRVLRSHPRGAVGQTAHLPANLSHITLLDHQKGSI